MGISLQLQFSYPDPICRDADVQEVETGSVKKCVKDAIVRGGKTRLARKSAREMSEGAVGR